MWDKTRSISCMEEKFPNFALVIPKKNFEAVTKSNNQIMSKAMEIKWETNGKSQKNVINVDG